MKYHSDVTGTPLAESHLERHFRDSRPPQEIQAHFEKTLMTVLRPGWLGAKLAYRTSAKIAGCIYAAELRFECALADGNCYTLLLDANWSSFAATHHDYFRKSTQSWFEYWTKPFPEAPLPRPEACPEDRYRAVAEAALAAEARLGEVGAVQQAILSAMRQGASFATAHKEGGTNLSWDGSRFRRADYGESEETETFRDDTAFLIFLRNFYDSEVSRNPYPDKLVELDAWRLIYRLLRR